LTFLSENKFTEEEIIITNTFLNTRRINNNNGFKTDNQKKFNNSISIKENYCQYITKRSTSTTEGKIEYEKKVVWADQQLEILPRYSKSVGKTKIKNVDCNLSFRPPSADAKRKHKPTLVKTEMNDSMANDEEIPENLGNFKNKMTISNISDVRSSDCNKKQKILNINSVKKALLIENISHHKKNQNIDIDRDLKSYKPSKLTLDYNKTLRQPIFTLASEPELGKNVIEGEVQSKYFQKTSNTANEFFKKEFKDLQNKIFAKPAEMINNENSNQKNSFSKVSTNVHEESLKHTPNDSDTVPIPHNFSFIQTIKNINPINITQAHTSKVDISQVKDHWSKPREQENSFLDFKSKLNRTTDHADAAKLIPSLHYDGMQENIDAKSLNQKSFNSTIFGKIQGPKKRQLETFISPSSNDFFFEDKKRDLLNKLKNLNFDDKYSQICSTKLRKERSPIKFALGNLKGSILPNDEKPCRLKIKRPNSAPSKDEKKESLIQKHLFFDSKNKNYIAQKLTNSVTPNQFFINKVTPTNPKEKRTAMGANSLKQTIF
jgi:hypothetical protein